MYRMITSSLADIVNFATLGAFTIISFKSANGLFYNMIKSDNKLKKHIGYISQLAFGTMFFMGAFMSDLYVIVEEDECCEDAEESVNEQQDI